MHDRGPVIVLSEEQKQPQQLWWWRLLLLAIILVSMGLYFAWTYLSRTPADFPKQKLILIPSGSPLAKIGDILEDEHIIRSNEAFIYLVRAKNAESRIPAGEYLFTEPQDLAGIVGRLTGGEHGIERVRVTIPEGTSLMGMGRIFESAFLNFDDTQFLAEAKGSEGYLFPDTYFFYSTATSGPILAKLQENFLVKTKPLHDETLSGKKKWGDIIIMASLIEEEAVTPEDRRIVSGILWKRIAKGMALQVDAPFAYIIGKNSATLSLDDLKTDSPYNTYRNKGLPPTPITNPGLDAIDAALHPTETKYFFYLSDKAGRMYYAKTFEEHKLNKEKYLR